MAAFDNLHWPLAKQMRTTQSFCSRLVRTHRRFQHRLAASTVSHENGDGFAGLHHLVGAPVQAQGYGSAPPPQPGEFPLWTEHLLPVPVPYERKVFCNRALNMEGIKAFGFDMDYTLAQYRPDTFEALAHSQTVNKLVRHFGYPEVLRSFTFSWDWMMKGLILDKAHGNVLKVDRHKYVKLCYHGFRPVSAEERNAIYNSNYQDLNFDSDQYSLVDTLFSLAEAYLWCQLIELKDSAHGSALASKTYAQLYKDLRTAVDMCHRDGSLKKAVAQNPEKYIWKDPMLKEVLVSMRAGGRRLFLATNSLWDYTNVAMNYVLDDKVGPDKSTDWLRFFDVVVVGCGKPGFFNSSGQLFHVDVKSGLLSNTDNGAPIIPVDEADRSEPAQPQPELPPGGMSPSRPRVFQGGCYRDLHRMLGVTSGEQVLYAGDHIYGDIVKAKKAIGWRTMLVVPELAVELKLQGETQMIQEELRVLRQQRGQLEDQIQRFEWALQQQGPNGDQDSQAYEKSAAMLQGLKERRASLKRMHSEQLRHLHHRHHPIWGQILKTGYQNSRFAHQVERYACIYTSHISNLAYYSPTQKWQGRLDILAHEDWHLTEPDQK
ncbi:purine 5'-nucleotidase [Haematococcus lacustris]